MSSDQNKLCTSVTTIAILICLLTISAPPTVNGYRVLGLFPVPVVSHFHFFQPILRGLAEAGHNVTVISNFPQKNPLINLTDIKLGNLPIMTNGVDLDMFKYARFLGPFLGFFNLFLLYQFSIETCDTALNSPIIQNLDANDYDVIMLEYFNCDCMQAIAWKLGLPVVGVSSSALMPWHYEPFGAPANPSYIPSLFTGNSDTMTYTDRIINWMNVHVMNWLYRQSIIRRADEIVKRSMGAGIPSVWEIVKNSSLIFVNQHYTMAGVKPLPPGVIELGGIHIQPAQPLADLELKRILDAATDGVIYVSWGSLIRSATMPEWMRTELLQAFGAMKQTVLWKYENETIPNKPDNVHIRQWLPQRDLLCHPNVKAFVTHGGMGGSSETIHCGVPAVVTPMYGDQHLNAAALVARGMGKILHFNDINKERMIAALQFVLQDVVQENARKVSHAYQNRLNTPLQTALWWIEHVAETKGAPLIRSRATHVPTLIYYSIDIYVTIALVILINVILLKWLVCSCLRKRRSAAIPKRKSD